MPTRIIRDGILTSEPISNLSFPAEVFYRRLMSVVDDHGRYYSTPMLLRAACYPLKLNTVHDSHITEWLDECVSQGLVQNYTGVDGKRYLLVLKFGQRVQSKSKFPEPRSDTDESTVDHGGSPKPTEENGLVVDVDVDVDEGDIGAPKGASRGIGLQAWLDSLGESEAIPADDPIFDYASKTGIPIEFLELSWKRFCEDMAERNKRQKDWRAHYRNAVRGNWYKIWWQDNDGNYQLTTSGKQAKAALA